MKQEQIYEAIMVKPDTKHKFRIRAVKEKKTNDELLKELLK